MRARGHLFLLLIVAASAPAAVWACSTFGAGEQGTPTGAAGPDGAPSTSTTGTSTPGPAVRCDPGGAFAKPTLVDGLNTAGDETGMWLSPDEKRAYVSA